MAAKWWKIDISYALERFAVGLVRRVCVIALEILRTKAKHLCETECRQVSALSLGTIHQRYTHFSSMNDVFPETQTIAPSSSALACRAPVRNLSLWREAKDFESPA
jgi:hypothetical protein